MVKIIQQDKSIIPACDVETLDQLRQIVTVTRDTGGVYAYKVGFELGYSGLGRVVDTIKGAYPGAKVIFDHQKAGTDVPFTGEKFARVMKACDVDAAILFPRERDPVCQYAWTQALLDEGVEPIIGSELTHRDVTDDIEQVYWNAVFQGVTNFVVPGNKPDRVKYYTDRFGKFGIDAVNFSPGFVEQGGEISEAGQAAGNRWHAICGRAVYNPKKRKNLDDVTEEEMAESVTALVKALGD